jgi:hypothetical protein
MGCGGKFNATLYWIKLTISIPWTIQTTILKKPNTNTDSWASITTSKCSLRDHASPQCEDIKVQASDSKLEGTKYEIKSKIIEMAAATPFEGMAM